MTIRDNQLLPTSKVALHPVAFPLTTAVSLTARPCLVILPIPGSKWVIEQASLFARTVAGAVSYDIRRVFGNGILATPLLAIDATPEKFKTTNPFAASIGGVIITKAATAAIVFSGAYVITGANKWGAFRVQINAAGTISTKGAASAYATEALAIAALPAVDTGNVSLGYISVQAKGATWTANTDDMTDGSDCVVAHFVSEATTGGSISVLDSALTPTAGVDKQATMATTFTARFGQPTDVLVVLETTDGTGALTDAYLRVGVRPYPLNGEA